MQKRKEFEQNFSTYVYRQPEKQFVLKKIESDHPRGKARAALSTILEKKGSLTPATNVAAHIPVDVSGVTSKVRSIRSEEELLLLGLKDK
mmetsp:Transcript_39015/g.59382  ORF Transcript_39015/g.59382 Transcript_39015/m.59382 type:complete len:90 (-) Transcript_39015:2227-2496(-)